MNPQDFWEFWCMRRQCVPGSLPKVSLGSRLAFPLFKAGHIQSVFVSTHNDIYKIKCICLPDEERYFIKYV